MSQFTEYATAAWRFSTRISLATGGNYHHGSALVATGASNFKRLRLSGELHSCTIRWYDPMAREVEKKKSEKRSQREVREKKPERSQKKSKNGLVGTRLFVLNRMAIKTWYRLELGSFFRRDSLRTNSIHSVDSTHLKLPFEICSQVLKDSLLRSKDDLTEKAIAFKANSWRILWIVYLPGTALNGKDFDSSNRGPWAL